MKTAKHYLVFLFCCVTLHLSAQFSIGIRGGYGSAWQEYGNVEVPDDARIHINGFQVSALTYFEINKHVSVGLEPGYTRRGAACIPGFVVFNNDAKLMLNYLELPLMILAKFPVYKDKWQVFGKAGYGVSKIMTGFQEISIIGGDEPPVRTKLDLNNPFGININRWDQGIYGCLGIAYKKGNNKLFMDLNNYFGLEDVDPSNTSKNRSIHLGLGYLISLN